MNEYTQVERGLLAMDADEFCTRVLDEFPELREDFEEWDGLIHLQVGEFHRFTQNAIEARSFEIVSRCFELANVALIDGDPQVKNAVYVTYLEHLDFRSDAGKEAKPLMPKTLKQGRDDVLDYDEKLLGRKWPTDDRD